MTTVPSSAAVQPELSSKAMTVRSNIVKNKESGNHVADHDVGSSRNTAKARVVKPGRSCTAAGFSAL